MKLKYQLRGLGIGIMVTALLMGVATGKGIPLSDAEIRAKALELGMVDRDSLKLTDIADVSPAPGENVLPENDGIPGAEGVNAAGYESESDGLDKADGFSETNASEKDVPEETVPDSGEEDFPEGGGTAGEHAAGAETSGEGDAVSGSAGEEIGEPAGDTVQIVIEYGVASDQVSEMLAEAGLVEDAAAFDAYLCNNGLSRNITAGTYEIVPGTSEEEIIRMITRNGAVQTEH